MAEKGKGKKEAEKPEAEDGEEGAKTESAPPKSRKKMILIVAAVVLVLALAAGVPVLLMSRSGETAETGEKKAPQEQAQEEERLVPEGFEEEDELDEDEEALGAIFPLDTFVVNLAGGQHYLRCQVQVEFTERDVPQRFYTRLVPIRDAAIKVMSARRPDELGSSEGKESLKEALKEMINDVLKKEEVKNIYFTQFVVQ